MLISKSYRLRIYPNKDQEALLVKTLGSCRFIWNHYLDKQSRAYMDNGAKLNYYDHCKDLTVLKRSKDFGWLSEINAHALQQSLRDLDFAYQNFFQKRANYPKFKSKYSSKQSFRKPDYISISNGRLSIQRDLVVRARGTNPPEGSKLCSVTVARMPSGKWYASIVTEQKIMVKKGKGNLGIDLGITDLVVTNEGERFPRFEVARGLLARKRFLQKALSRKEKSSKNRERARAKFGKIQERITNQRHNYLHHVSKAIADKNHAVIVLEDLAVTNMMKNHSLARVIGEASWATLIGQIEYKQFWRGNNIIEIDRFFPSSKACSNCSYIAASLSLKIREWQCPRCEVTHDRDINAAKNILKQGLNTQGPGNGLRMRRRKRMVSEALAEPRVTTPMKY